jgi:hypothetical protein
VKALTVHAWVPDIKDTLCGRDPKTVITDWAVRQNPKVVEALGKMRPLRRCAVCFRGMIFAVVKPGPEKGGR